MHRLVRTRRNALSHYKHTPYTHDFFSNARTLVKVSCDKANLDLADKLAELKVEHSIEVMLCVRVCVRVCVCVEKVCLRERERV